MAIRAKKQSPWFAVLITAAAVTLWALDQWRAGSDGQPRTDRREPVSASPPPSSKPPHPGKQESHAGAGNRQGRYEVHRNCALATDNSNDGDSFRVLLPDGRREIFRLYFVDTPESAFKSYRNGENNHQRIREQAAHFGITSEEAVEVGREGKRFVLGLLGNRPFTLHTEWDSPFRDQRYHAFIQVSDGGKPRWLHELLLEKGFARLKTKPADLPDGTKADDHRRYLEGIQSAARKSRTGGWNMARPAGAR
jgi:endonuclease YncB( thermonuclease family)